MPHTGLYETSSSLRTQFMEEQRTSIVPPYTIIVGRLWRAAAMAHPGMFLSHPGMEIFPS